MKLTEIHSVTPYKVCVVEDTKFSSELKFLIQGSLVSSNNKVLTLNVFLDDDS